MYEAEHESEIFNEEPHWYIQYTKLYHITMFLQRYLKIFCADLLGRIMLFLVVITRDFVFRKD